MDLSESWPLAVVINGSWRPGIGDPTVFGWATVAAYLLAAAFCGWAAVQERRRRWDVPEIPRSPVFWRSGVTDGARSIAPARTTGPLFWWLLAALLLALGVNKQLDLQSALTTIGRRVAREQGWYEGRAAIQKAFVAGVAAVGVAALGVGAVVFRRAIGRRPLAALGALFVVVFVVVRAASFHHVDRFLATEVSGLRWNWILELGGIGLIIASVTTHLRRS